MRDHYFSTVADSDSGTELAENVVWPLLGSQEARESPGCESEDEEV